MGFFRTLTLSWLVVFSFQQSDSFVYKSYYKLIYCTPSSDIRMPATVSVVQTILQNAITAGQKVKAFGSRHSQTDVICTDGIPISMKAINYTLNNGDGTATFGAGLELISALQFLESQGLSLIHVPAYAGITIGGAVGCGAHGSSLVHTTSLSDQVVALAVIDGTGTIRSVTDPNELKAWRVHLGLLGIVVDVTLKVVPLFKMRVENKVQPESILFDGTAISWARQYDWFQFFWFPAFQEVVVSKGNYTDASVPGNASTNLIPDESPEVIEASREGFEFLHSTRLRSGEAGLEKYTQYSLYTEVVGKPPIFSEDGKTVVNPAIGYAWRLQANKCTNNCVWGNGEGKSVESDLYSIAFDVSQFAPVMSFVKQMGHQYPMSFYVEGIMVRFFKASDSLMATASGRDSFTVEWVTPMRIDPYQTSKNSLWTHQAMQQALVANFGGRPHWAKNGLHYTTKAIKAAPNRNAFIAAMRANDPNGIFLNKFGKRMLGESDEMDKDPQATRCALQDYCVCSKAADCAANQFCGNINGFRVCMDLVPLNPPAVQFPDLKNLTSIFQILGVHNP